MPRLPRAEPMIMRVSVVRSRQRFRYGLRQATSPLHLGQGSGHLPRLRSLVEQAAVRRFAIDLGGIDNCDGDRHLKKGWRPGTHPVARPGFSRCQSLPPL